MQRYSLPQAKYWGLYQNISKVDGTVRQYGTTRVGLVSLMKMLWTGSLPITANKYLLLLMGQSEKCTSSLLKTFYYLYQNPRLLT